jgi:hypothetical protein
MEVECFKVKLKPNTVHLVREWSARLNSEMVDVRRLLKNEGMNLESVFLEQSNEGDFLIYYVRSPDLKRTREVFGASQHPIDVYHRETMKNIAESSRQLECLLDADSE